MRPICPYCLGEVYERELGSAYMIVEATEALIWAHVECIQVYEDINLYAIDYR